MPALSVSAILSYAKGKITMYSDPSLVTFQAGAVPVEVDGKYAIQGVETITTSDETLPLGDIGTIGFVYLRNLSPAIPATPAAPIITNVVIPTPDISEVTNVGTAGSTTVTYKIQAVFDGGDLSPASAAASTTTSNATLTVSNFNRITWDAVPGAANYNVYRTVAPTTPSTTGIIGNVGTLSFDDLAYAGDGTTAPTFTNSATWTYKLVAYGGENSDSYTVASAGGSTSTGRTVLSVNNYNFLKWLPVPGATSYDVYRTVSGGTPDETGFFANVSAGAQPFLNPVDGLLYETVKDTGVEGDSTSAPSTTPWDFPLIVGPDGSSYPLKLKGTEPFVGRWNAAAIHVKATVNSATLFYLLIEA